MTWFGKRRRPPLQQPEVVVDDPQHLELFMPVPLDADFCAGDAMRISLYFPLEGGTTMTVKLIPRVTWRRRLRWFWGDLFGRTARHASP